MGRRGRSIIRAIVRRSPVDDENRFTLLPPITLEPGGRLRRHTTVPTGCVASAFLSIPAGIVIGIAATYIAPYWGVCRSDQATRIMLFTYSIGCGVSFFAMYLRSGGFLRSFFFAVLVTRSPRRKRRRPRSASGPTHSANSHDSRHPVRRDPLRTRRNARPCVPRTSTFRTLQRFGYPATLALRFRSTRSLHAPACFRGGAPRDRARRRRPRSAAAPPLRGSE